MADSHLHNFTKGFARLAANHPKKIDLSLDRMHRLLASLNHPENHQPPTIHIAGTNGKGSTLAFLTSLLRTAGKTTHLYTSPHLIYFHERIQPAGKPISDNELETLIDEVEKANQGEPLSFFEAMTAVALLAFSKISADFCLLETGLGGRLDATNTIANPRLTIITPVDYDHQAFLGDRLEDIAFEKAGIIKANTPLILARQKKEALEVIEKKARALKSPLFYQGKDWRVEKTTTGWLYQDDQTNYALPSPALAGDHQLVNASCALFAFHQLSPPLDQDQTAKALCRTQWPGRLQKIHLCGKEAFLDGGHNVAAANVLADFIQKEKEGRTVYLICALRQTKPAKDFLTPFTNNVDQVITLDLPLEGQTPGETSKFYPRDKLATMARTLNLSASAAININAALHAIPKTIGGKKPLILIAGSLLLAGKVLSQLK